MKMPKLERHFNEYEINANPPDRLSLWPSLFGEDRHNLTLEDRNGRSILAIYGFTLEQLSALYAEIGSVLSECNRQGNSGV